MIFEYVWTVSCLSTHELWTRELKVASVQGGAPRHIPQLHPIRIIFVCWCNLMYKLLDSELINQFSYPVLLQVSYTSHPIPRSLGEINEQNIIHKIHTQHANSPLNPQSTSICLALFVAEIPQFLFPQRFGEHREKSAFQARPLAAVLCGQLLWFVAAWQDGQDGCVTGTSPCNRWIIRL